MASTLRQGRLPVSWRKYFYELWHHREWRMAEVQGTHHSLEWTWWHLSILRWIFPNSWLTLQLQGQLLHSSPCPLSIGWLGSTQLGLATSPFAIFSAWNERYHTNALSKLAKSEILRKSVSNNSCCKYKKISRPNYNILLISYHSRLNFDIYFLSAFRLEKPDINLKIDLEYGELLLILHLKKYLI